MTTEEENAATLEPNNLPLSAQPPESQSHSIQEGHSQFDPTTQQDILPSPFPDYETSSQETILARKYSDRCLECQRIVGACFRI
jgi:hypothetical protein